MTQAVLLVLLGLVAFGCTPKIGDSCTVSTNCSASGDRLCDITQPGGYCTVFNCEPDGCPADSACINFGTELSSVNLCQSSQGNSPYQRSFCLATCSVDGDCRGGYKCLPLSGTTPNMYGAVLADNSGDGKVCAVAPAEGMMAIPMGPTNNEVCLGSDAGAPVSATPGDGSEAGAGGASGASNDAGAGG